VNTPLHGVIDTYADRDWFKVQLNAGTDYVVNLSGFDGGGGTLDDPVLTLHDATGAQVAFNDDVSFESFDSQLIVHPTTSGTYFLEAGEYADFSGGSYTLSVQAGAAQSTSGSDFLVGTLAGGTIMAGGGNDTITADNATNYLRGEDGDDSVVGGSGFDDINGNMGADTINGGLGDDWVVGGKGDDQQFGYDGDDIVWGNLGNDTLDGGFGADQVRGGQGNDVVNGGPGNDYVSGDRGDDTVTGGSGADRFHDSQDAGIDRVTDFNYAQGDRVQLDPGTTFTASQVGADTVLDMGGGNQMILAGVNLASLPPDYVFFG
jgi:serralysin